MKPTGEDAAAAIKDWAKQEVKNSPSYRMDFGKFFFSISTGTTAFFLSIKKFESSYISNIIEIWPILIVISSSFIAITMVVPNTWDFSKEYDLFYEYNRQIRRTITSIWLWFFTWLIGTILSVYWIMMRHL